MHVGRLAMVRLKIVCRAFKETLRHRSVFLFIARGGSGGLNVKTQPESRCPELLANFCDMLLRKTPYSKRLTSDEIQAKLKDVVSLFLCCVRDCGWKTGETGKVWLSCSSLVT